MLVKLYNCLEYIKKCEEEYEEILKKKTEDLRKKGLTVTLKLNKIVKETDENLYVKYDGLKIISEEEPENIILPPKFILDGFEYYVVNEVMLCTYGFYRKFSNVLKKCHLEPVLNVGLEEFIKHLCGEIKNSVKKYSRILRVKVEWIPLVSASVLNKLCKKFKLDRQDVIDILFYLKDNEKLFLTLGERGEIWLNTSKSCR